MLGEHIAAEDSPRLAHANVARRIQHIGLLETGDELAREFQQQPLLPPPLDLGTRHVGRIGAVDVVDPHRIDQRGAAVRHHGLDAEIVTVGIEVALPARFLDQPEKAEDPNVPALDIEHHLVRVLGELAGVFDDVAQHALHIYPAEAEQQRHRAHLVVGLAPLHHRRAAARRDIGVAARVDQDFSSTALRAPLFSTTRPQTRSRSMITSAQIVCSSSATCFSATISKATPLKIS